MIPTKHEGAQVTEMRRKGVITWIAKLNDEMKEENKIIKCQLIEKQQNLNYSHNRGNTSQDNQQNKSPFKKGLSLSRILCKHFLL